MRSRWRLWTGLGVAGVALVALVLWGAWQASQHVPEFYSQALANPPADQSDASSRLGTRATALFSDLRRLGRWESLFSADEVNAWLAVDLVKKHSDLLPGHIREPRVEIQPDHIALAFRYDSEALSTVFSLALEPYLAAPNVIAIRVRQVRAGALPLPMNDVLEEITRLGRALELDLTWAQSEGDPVAMISVEPGRDAERRQVWIESLELRPGELFLAGRTMTDEDAVRERRAALQSRADVQDGGTSATRHN